MFLCLTCIVLYSNTSALNFIVNNSNSQNQYEKQVHFSHTSIQASHAHAHAHAHAAEDEDVHSQLPRGKVIKHKSTTVEQPKKVIGDAAKEYNQLSEKAMHKKSKMEWKKVEDPGETGEDNTLHLEINEDELQNNRRKWTKLDLPSLENMPELSRKIEKKDLFLHQGNYKKLLQHYADEDEDLNIKNYRSFPDANLAFLRKYEFDTCAVVGNSGGLLNATFGRAIDSHSLVLRFNQAPQGDPENQLSKYVGTKTTLRLINTRWTNKYGTIHFLEQGLPLEPGVTLLVSRARPKSYDTIAQTLKKARPDVRLLYLSSRVVSAARQLLVAYRLRLEEAGYENIPGGNTPSSGFVGVYMLMHACKNVTVYGFGLDNNSGNTQNYHYFHILSPEHSKKKNSMNPTHSFDTEKLLLRNLAKNNLIKFCGIQPGDRKHKKTCGLHAHTSRKNRVAADNFELDFIKLKSSRRGKP